MEAGQLHSQTTFLSLGFYDSYGNDKLYNVFLAFIKVAEFTNKSCECVRIHFGFTPNHSTCWIRFKYLLRKSSACSFAQKQGKILELFAEYKKSLIEIYM